MGKQDIKKVFNFAVIDKEEMVIREHNKDGDLTGVFSLQAIIDDIANSEDFVNLTIAYTSSIASDIEE